MSIGSLNRIRQTLIDARERTGADVDMYEQLDRAVIEINGLLDDAVSTRDVDTILATPTPDYAQRIKCFTTNLREAVTLSLPGTPT